MQDEQFKRAKERYWNDVDNYLDRWLAHPRPLAENMKLQIVERDNFIEFDRALTERSVVTAESMEDSLSGKATSQLMTETKAISQAVTGYFSRYNINRNTMLQLVAALLKARSSNEISSRCLLHLAKTGSPFFFNLPRPMLKQLVVPIYQNQKDLGLETEFEGLDYLVQSLAACDTDWVVLADLIFEDEAFLVITDSPVNALIGILADRKSNIFQYYISRAQIPETVPRLS